LYGVLMYSTLSIISGVFSNDPGCVRNSGRGFSAGFQVQATSSVETFWRLMSAARDH
jgi:uncharacterized protein YegJ (DUF2314 family)